LSSEHVHNSVEVIRSATGTIDHAVRAAVANVSDAPRRFQPFEAAAIRGFLEEVRVERSRVTVTRRFRRAYAGRP